jgi:hypothetical protein|tara:strand:- start:335 stop:496 length:162 start_codon:yes stop_codon:yes gene_type:complete
MARKDANGVKHNKSSNAKETRKKMGQYSQKAIRSKEALLEKSREKQVKDTTSK